MARRAESDKVQLFDFFVETPRKRRSANEVEFFPINADFGPAKQEFHIGLGSSATPGMAPGLFALHEALGRLPMKRLVEPAARAARAGFPLSSFQAYLFTVIAPILTASPGVARSSRRAASCWRRARPSAIRSLPRPSNGSPRMARACSSTAMSAAPSSRSRRAGRPSHPRISSDMGSSGASLCCGGIAAPPSRSTRRRRPAAR